MWLILTILSVLAVAAVMSRRRRRSVEEMHRDRMGAGPRSHERHHAEAHTLANLHQHQVHHHGPF